MDCVVYHVCSRPRAGYALRKDISDMFTRFMMKTKCLSLVAALSGFLVVQAGFAETPVHGIDQFVILVHPCPYEALGTADTDPYRVLERAACQRWFDAIPSLPQSTFVIQVDFSSEGLSADKLHKAFIDRLGSGRVRRIPCRIISPEDPNSLKDYYESINQEISGQIATQGLTFDRITCKSFIWGQSFEGCAAGFGSAIAGGLGLKTPTQLLYEMSAPDAPFLLNAEFVQNVPVPNSDVQAYIFDLTDGRCAAFFRSCLTPQWLDHRPIELRLNSDTFAVITKQGDPVWPHGVPPTASQKECTRYNQWRTVVWPKGTQPPGPLSFTLATVQERYVITTKPHMRELISAIQSAVVEPQAK